MVGPISRLRCFLRSYFTSKIVAVDDKPLAIAQDTTRKVKSRKRYRSVQPSEKFVWAMVVLIIALMGLVAIEVSYILVAGSINVEILIVISGLIGAISSRFLEAKR